MTKREIFDKEFYFLRDFLMYKSTPVRLKDIVLGCMEQYANQEIQSLQSELTRLRKENSMLVDKLNEI